MIYLKKPVGTIHQFEDDMRQALNIDKEIQGESFGEIYTEESLPDEDKISLGLMTQKELDAKILKASNEKKIYEARQYLAETDYKIIKEMETGEKCPEDILVKRTECRKIINDLQGA
ncbi:MAG: hypothetical protein CVV49_08795 [Spirochaetae bacterium HGW-Spirochaetae-5]|nr:MAG: hypothetical protein CVV49_08795 [Spirochaetae bacterium HGW-Spirochaetae-5]